MGRAERHIAQPAVGVVQQLGAPDPQHDAGSGQLGRLYIAAFARVAAQGGRPYDHGAVWASLTAAEARGLAARLLAQASLIERGDTETTIVARP